MSLKTIFKRLILLELLLILAITSSFFYESKEVMSFNESMPIADGILIFGVVWFLALFASLYLLYNFKKIETPTGIAMFPAEMSTWPPRSYLERMFNIQQLTKMPKGGHFAALEQPDLLIKDLTKFAKKNFN